jgi:phage shock protein A
MTEDSSTADRDAETVDPAPEDDHPTVPVDQSGTVHQIDTGYTDAGVPTLDGVREKIATRYGTALGATELAAETPEARSAAEQFEKRQQAAAAKLDEIRASMDRKD